MFSGLEIDATPLLRRLKWRGVWLPVGTISLLLLAKGVFEFHHDPRWNYQIVAISFMTISLITAGAYLFLNSIFGIVREREKAVEEKNRQALTLERRFQALIENSSDGVVLADSHGQSLYASHSTSRILDYSPEELVGRQIFDLIHPDDCEASEARFTRVLQRPGEFVTGSFRARHKNGSWRWMEAVTSNLLADPSVQGVVTNFRDITERRLAEEAIQAANQRLTSVLESITDAFFALDEQWRFIELNSLAVQDIFRRPAVELLGKVLWREFPHLAGTELDRQLETATTEGRYVHFESSSGLVEGKWFEVHVYPRNGRAEVYLRDITRRKLAEEERERLLEKVEQGRQRAEALAVRDEAILNNMTEGLVTFDLNGSILDMNPAALRMHGLEQAGDAQRQLSQSPAIFELQHLDGRPVAMEEWPVTRVLRGETFTANEAKARRQDTGALWIGSYSGTLARDKIGRPLLGVLTFHDVTARKQAEAALEERARLATLTAEVGRAFVVTDDLRANLRRCVGAIVHHLDAAFALIWTTNGETQLLQLQASAGLPTYLDGSDGSISLGQVKISQIARDQRPLLTNRALDDAAVSDQDWVRREGLVAFAGIPLVVDERLVGALAVFARHPMTDAAFLGLVSISGEIALNIERLWTKETLRRTNEELERRVLERTAELAQSNESLQAEIAERRRAEEALRESQARLSAIISSAMDAIIVLDAHQRVVLFNAAAEEIFRYSAAETIGQPLEQFLPERVRQVHPEHVRTFDERGLDRYRIGTERAVTGRKADGTEFPAEISVSQVRIGEEKFYTAIVRDISERKQAEEALRRSEHAAAIGRIAAGVTHEIRTPLSALAINLQLLTRALGKTSFSSEEVHQLINTASAEVNRINYALEEFVQYARLPKPKFASVQLNALLEEIAEVMRARAQESAVEITTRLQGSLPHIQGDPDQLRQLFLNLVANAIEAMPGGGQVGLETWSSGEGQARIIARVVDTGPGIPPATLPHIFDLFFSTKERGLGMGLAIVKRIVEEHRGTIQCQSQEGNGTTFDVMLPHAHADA